MFDDLKPKPPQADNAGGENEQKNKQIGEEGLSAPTASKQQVEDMFAETDKVSEVGSGSRAQQADHPVKPPVFQPKRPASPEELSAENADAPLSAGPKWAAGVKKYTMLAAMVVAAIAVLSGGWYAYSKFFAASGDMIPADDSSKGQAVENNGTTEQENSASEIKERKQEEKPIVKPPDKDHDGLSDEEEIRLGTNPNNVDTDDDGLFDREEVRVYKTDPLNYDTDGDGFSDGEEVKNGYDPNGEGKLYKIEK